jgi:DNA-binding beta-propeller fold protein YncE
VNKIPQVLRALGLAGCLAGAADASAQGTSYQFLSAFGSPGSGQGQFLGPQGLNFIAIDPVDHSILVGDGGNDRLQFFDAGGIYLRQFGTPGTGPGEFSGVAGMTVDPATRRVLVADANGHVDFFSESGQYLGQFGGEGTDDGEFGAIGSIKVDPLTRNIVVTDFVLNRVQVFSAAGIYLGKFGGQGSGDGQFQYAEYLTIDPITRDILVADAIRNNVQVFSPSGAYLGRFGGPGSGNGQFGFPGPSDVVVDAVTQHIVVGDYGNNRVQVFSMAGDYLATFGEAGTGNGQFEGPTGIALDPSTHQLAIEDRGDSRVELFSLGDTPPPPPCGATPVILSMTPNPANTSVAVDFFAQASIAAPFAGTVSFEIDGAGDACTASMLDVDATCSHALTPGTHTVVARYSGDGVNAPGCSLPQSIVVDANPGTTPTLTTCQLAGGPPVQGQPASVQCTVTPPAGIDAPDGNAAPDGYLTLARGSSVLGTMPLFAGTAVFTMPLDGGSYSLTVSYSGDAVDLDSTTSIAVTVDVPPDDLFYGAFDPR